MVLNKNVIVIMPAYNAEKTIRKTIDDLPKGIVDEVIVIDDGSIDGTINIVSDLDVELIIHPRNLGYGAAQKTGYRKAIEKGADIIIMLHPDYQYSPRLVPALASMIASGHYDMVLGSRISGGGALKGGMPLYKYLANRFLSGVANVVLGLRLSEYHTGFRAFEAGFLKRLGFERNSDGFVFDHEIIVQAVLAGGRIGEISCPTRYFPDASSIGLWQSIKYGLGVLLTLTRYILQKAGLGRV